MRRFLSTLGAFAGAGMVMSLFAGQAHAVPTCNTTITATSGVAIPAADLVPGVCVAAGDKIFGSWGSTGGSGLASAIFTFAGFGTVTLGIQDALVGPATGAGSTTATLTYEVEVSPAAQALGWRIENLEKDITLNATDGVNSAHATLTGTTVPVTSPPVNINCVRNVNPSTGSTCPQTDVFATITDFTINETVAAFANTTVTGLTDTISQKQIPEPASLGLLGTGLLGLGLGLRARRRRH